MEEGPMIGIDLGTTYSCAAVSKNGQYSIIPIDGRNTMASCVSFHEDGRKIGNEAKDESIQNPVNTVLGVKRYIGCRFEDLELQTDFSSYLYKIFDNSGNVTIKIVVNNEELLFTPEEISSMILRRIKESAEAYLGKSVCKAVITVPTHFKDAQRQATRDAGTIAGLDVQRIINEPTAAALAYGIDDKYRNDLQERNILVYDFGGGTFDVSIISIDSGVFEVKATFGDTHLGGDDIDQCLVEYFSAQFEERNPDIVIANNPRAVRKLRMCCERVKKELSAATISSIDLDEFIDGNDFICTIQRETFENLFMVKVAKTLEYVQKALDIAELTKDKIDDILLVGGSTRIPLVQNMITDFFNGKKPNASLNPDEAVAIGAAIQASILDGEENQTTGALLLLDTTSLSLGLETAGGIFTPVISRNTQIPVKITRKFTNEKDNQTKVKILVYEGERAIAKDNNKLGEFILTGLTPKKRASSQINVTFEVNTDGILFMGAEELNEESGVNLHVEVNKRNLDETEIARMISVAQKFHVADARKRELIAARIALENFCFDSKHKAEQFVTEAEDRNVIIKKCEDTIEWVRTHEVDLKQTYEAKKSEVNTFCFPILKQYL